MRTPRMLLTDRPAPHPNARYGSANGRSRGGEPVASTEGYLRIRVGNDHPLAHADGYAYIHELTWAAAGRPAPLAHELLHHISGDKTDNRIDNLTIITRSEHSRLHAAEMPRVRGRFVRAEYVGGGSAT